MGTIKIMKVRASLGIAIFLVSSGGVSANAATLYTDIPAGTATGSSPDFNYSVPFYQDQITEFGGLIILAGGNSAATTGGQLALSNWAQEANYTAYINANPNNGSSGADTTGYWASVTVNVYGVGATTGTYNGDPLYSVGSLLNTSTTSVFIDWRPAATGGDSNSYLCSDASHSFNNGGTEQCGAVNLVNFDLSASLPSTVFYTVSVATGTDGNGNPLPGDSLNFGLNANPAQAGGTGSSDPDTAYYNGAAGNYTGGVPYTADTVQGDTGWSGSGYGAISFDAATPEPATFGMIGFGLLGLGFFARKRRTA